MSDNQNENAETWGEAQSPQPVDAKLNLHIGLQMFSKCRVALVDQETGEIEYVKPTHMIYEDATDSSDPLSNMLTVNVPRPRTPVPQMDTGARQGAALAMQRAEKAEAGLLRLAGLVAEFMNLHTELSRCVAPLSCEGQEAVNSLNDIADLIRKEAVRIVEGGS